MKLVEKSDGNGNIIMVEDHDWMNDEARNCQTATNYETRTNI